MTAGSLSVSPDEDQPVPSPVEVLTTLAQRVGFAVITVDRDGDPDLDSAELYEHRHDAESEVAMARRETALLGRAERHAVAAVVLLEEPR